jgi:hypothetical protein
MTMRKFIWIAAGALLVLVAWEGLRQAVPAVGEPAPPVRAASIAGQTVDLAALKGRSPVLLNFFSST